MTPTELIAEARELDRILERETTPMYKRMDRPIVYALDFDGTLCENAWPAIGAPRTEVIEHFKAKRKQGDKLILWTCREGEKLAEAVEWCKSHGLEFDAVNANLPDWIEAFGNDCRKIGADFYVDDKNYFMAGV